MRDKKQVTSISLPNTRFELFGKTIKNNVLPIINLSLVLFAFSLPLLLIYGLLYLGLISIKISENYPEAVNLVFYFGLAAIIGYIILYAGLGGGFYIAKKLAWNEPLLYKKHFLKGIKDNLKKSIFMGIVVGVSVLIATWGSLFLYAFALSNELMNYIGIGALLLQAMIVLMLSMIYMAQNCVYSLKVQDLIKNSFILTLTSLFKSTLLFVISYGLIIGLLLFDIITIIIAIILIAFFGFVLVYAWTLLSHHLFDQYINKTNYPDDLNKGLNRHEK